jgi:hypothetical protein
MGCGMHTLGRPGPAALLLGFGVVVSTGCAASVDEEEATATSPDELRSDPSATVPTVDPSISLLSGYNAFLDQPATTPCVSTAGAKAPQIGAVQGSYYLRQVKTREELATELDVDLTASVKAPQGEIDASTKIVQTFKGSSTTVNFLLRAFRSYVATNTSDIELSPNALDMLTRKAMPEFLQKCGGSYVKSVRYDAQVIALLQFEAKTEESARNIAATIGGSSPSVAKKLTSASAEIKANAQRTAESNNATLWVIVTASGFISNNKRINGDVVENSFEKIDELHKDLATSFDRDLAADRANYDGNNGRNMRSAMVGQASYATLKNAPEIDFNVNTTTLMNAEKHVQRIAPLVLRMERAYDDEIMAFLNDRQNQFRYNLVPAPRLRSNDLVGIAQTWADKFKTDAAGGHLVEPLRHAVERCMGSAANSKYEACASTPEIESARARAEAALGEYNRVGRILPVSALMPTPGKTVSHYNAEGVCSGIGMRLPKRSEARLIGPSVAALAGEAGEVWLAGDDQCGKLVFKNGSGEGQLVCDGGWFEWAPWVRDRQVVCVPKSGPIGGHPAP